MHAAAVLSLAFAGLALGQGFTIPDGTSDGVYAVSFDLDGNAIHTQLNGTMSALKMPRRGLGASSRKERRGPQVGDVTCGTAGLNPGYTDAANAALDGQCDNGVQATKDAPHMYSIRGDVVAYFCQFGGSQYSCDSGTRGANDLAISTKCNKYVSGWTSYNAGGSSYWSYGYDTSNSHYCGS